eukprot:TRINITY_DN34196_c0_g1_i8.p1 TRINITY_DN34196_c0_g1~~TRINITY_DN34196_c0_g1_i8.p1  ORF type:complete len:859 (+),score=136.43 TRINITY_DN34196_c0_g1_i8:148-2724(+)
MEVSDRMGCRCVRNLLLLFASARIALADPACALKLSPRAITLIDQERGDEEYTYSTFEVSCKDVYKTGSEVTRKPWPVYMKTCDWGTYDPEQGGCTRCPYSAEEVDRKSLISLDKKGRVTELEFMYCSDHANPDLPTCECSARDKRTWAEKKFTTKKTLMCSANDPGCMRTAPVRYLWQREGGAVMLPELDCPGLKNATFQKAPQGVPTAMLLPVTEQDRLYTMLRSLFSWGFEDMQDIYEEVMASPRDDKVTVLIMEKQQKQGQEIKIGPSAQEMQAHCSVKMNMFMGRDGSDANAVYGNKPLKVDLIPFMPPPCIADAMNNVSDEFAETLETIDSLSNMSMKCWNPDGGKEQPEDPCNPKLEHDGRKEVHRQVQCAASSALPASECVDCGVSLVCSSPVHHESCVGDAGRQVSSSRRRKVGEVVSHGCCKRQRCEKCIGCRQHRVGICRQCSGVRACQSNWQVDASELQGDSVRQDSSLHDVRLQERDGDGDRWSHEASNVGLPRAYQDALPRAEEERVSSTQLRVARIDRAPEREGGEEGGGAGAHRGAREGGRRNAHACKGSSSKGGRRRDAARGRDEETAVHESDRIMRQDRPTGACVRQELDEARDGSARDSEASSSSAVRYIVHDSEGTAATVSCTEGRAREKSEQAAGRLRSAGPQVSDSQRVASALKERGLHSQLLDRMLGGLENGDAESSLFDSDAPAPRSAAPGKPVSFVKASSDQVSDSAQVSSCYPACDLAERRFLFGEELRESGLGGLCGGPMNMWRIRNDITQWQKRDPEWKSQSIDERHAERVERVSQTRQELLVVVEDQEVSSFEAPSQPQNSIPEFTSSLADFEAFEEDLIFAAAHHRDE